MSFWGHIVKPGKRYEQTVEIPFHISQACLEISKDNKKGLTTLILESNGEDFILCHVDQNKMSRNLDLQFDVGEDICFRTEGPGTVHLTGYVLVNDDDGDLMGFDDSDELDEEEIPELVNGKKRKLSDSSDSKLAKKSKNISEEKAAIQKAKDMSSKIAKGNKKISEKSIEEINDSDEDSDDDDDDDSDDIEMEEEGSDEDDSDEDGEEEDSDDESVEELPMKKKENGVTPQKKPNGLSPNKKAQTPGKKDAKTPNKDAKTPNKDSKTPGKDAKTPGKDAKTPGKDAKTPGKDAKTPNNKDTTAMPKKTPKRTLKGNIIVEDLKIGSGPEAKRGKMVGMYYQGRLATNGKQFDANTNGDPFKFKLGMGEVIKGWDLGLEGMKVGGKRKLTIPPKMAYGSDKSGPIPPNSTLVFEVECKYVK